MISTHALTWSATVTGAFQRPGHQGFQLTHSRGVRRYFRVCAMPVKTFQLTHSRGVRPFGLTAFVCSCSFQLTHSRGVRPSCEKNNAAARKFQLTHSRGVRPWVDRYIRAMLTDFNSRTHVECDGAPRPPIKMPVYFNSRTHVECDRIDLETGEIQ